MRPAVEEGETHTRTHQSRSFTQWDVCVDESEVLGSVVDDVGDAVSRNICGAQLLQELLTSPWLHALLKVKPTPL